MSKEKSWIDTCGLGRDLGLDGKSSKRKKISAKDNIPNIANQINVIIEELKDLKIFMSSTFIYVKEDSLKSQEYSFLNPPNDIKNVYVRAYHILQVNVMAIEELLKELKELDETKDTYRTKLQDVKVRFRGLLCNVELILISEALDYTDVTEKLMSKAFQTQKGSLKIEKHFIAIRQIQANMNYLLEEFQNNSKKLKSDNPSI